MCSSLAAFAVSEHLNNRFFQWIFSIPFFDVYKRFIKQRREFGVFLIRALMASPFNISFIAGLTHMDISEFIIATAFGVIPETVSFVYIGTLIQHTRIRLWYIFMLLVALAVLPLITMMIIKLFSREKTKIRS
jgi:uncharacterized membrane protein YdjX (TVP38/TMEM64 family)